MSSLLLTEILKASGVDAKEKLPEDIGLVTDGEFRNATVDFGKPEAIVSGALKGRAVCVVPGFYGVSGKGKVTLFGRGGSDCSAAAVARCIKASSLDIWKDVGGYMTADPKIVEGARRIERLSYTEAAELSYFGVKILHPHTVEPLLEHAIPVRIFNIDGVDPLKPALSEITGDRTVNASAAKASSLLDSGGINIKSVVTTQTVINFYLEPQDLDRAYDILRAHHDGTVATVTPFEDLSIVALVGEGITETPGIVDKMISTIAKQGINMKILSFGASEVAAHIVVARGDSEQAVRTILYTFFCDPV